MPCAYAHVSVIKIRPVIMSAGFRYYLIVVSLMSALNRRPGVARSVKDLRWSSRRTSASFVLLRPERSAAWHRIAVVSGERRSRTLIPFSLLTCAGICVLP